MSRSSGYHEINNKNAAELRFDPAAETQTCTASYAHRPQAQRVRVWRKCLWVSISFTTRPPAQGDTDLRHIQHFTNVRERPIDGLAVDHQRRGKADDVVVGLLRKDALFLQSLAESARAGGFRLELDADQ
jgi:hypothetical protein